MGHLHLGARTVQKWPPKPLCCFLAYCAWGPLSRNIWVYLGSLPHLAIWKNNLHAMGNSGRSIWVSTSSSWHPLVFTVLVVEDVHVPSALGLYCSHRGWTIHIGVNEPCWLIDTGDLAECICIILYYVYRDWDAGSSCSRPSRIVAMFGSAGEQILGFEMQARKVKHVRWW